LLLAPAAPAAAQQGAYCNVTRISYRRAANAVQVTVQADGAIRLDFDFMRLFDTTAMSEGRWNDVSRAITAFPFRITNARSRVPSLTDVSIYPVSHVESSIPPDSPNGVGVNVNVVLDTPSKVGTLRTGEDEVGFGGGGTGFPIIDLEMSRDQTSVIITVVGDRRTAPAFQRRTAPAGAPVRLNVHAEAGLVDVDALNADLEDVVNAVARETGISVSTDGQVRRTVSLNLVGVTPESLLAALARSYDASLVKEGGSYRLSSGTVRSGAAYAISDERTVVLRYIPAVIARNCLPEFLARFIHVDEARNALVATGPASVLDKIAADLAVLDRPTPNIEVTGTIVEFSDSADAEWVTDAVRRWSSGAAGANAGTGDLWFETLDGAARSLEWYINLLAGSGRARVRALPRMTALSGRTGRLFAGERKYIEVVENDMWAGPFSRLEDVDVGVELAVAPHIAGKEIIATVSVKLASVASVEGGSGLPTLYVRTASSSLRLEDGGTIVVGGLDQTQRNRARGRIPVLSRLPLVGRLFEWSTTRATATRTLVFLTARSNPASVVVTPEN
jgi:type II secretory pathway component GspD/PulD (secretin)